jgi:hypothetical protein
MLINASEMSGYAISASITSDAGPDISQGKNRSGLFLNIIIF